MDPSRALAFLRAAYGGSVPHFDDGGATPEDQPADPQPANHPMSTLGPEGTTLGDIFDENAHPQYSYDVAFGGADPTAELEAFKAMPATPSNVEMAVSWGNQYKKPPPATLPQELAWLDSDAGDPRFPGKSWSWLQQNQIIDNPNVALGISQVPQGTALQMSRDAAADPAANLTGPFGGWFIGAPGLPEGLQTVDPRGAMAATPGVSWDTAPPFERSAEQEVGHPTGWSTNNWRLLPPGYRDPGNIMRNGFILDTQSFGASHRGPGWTAPSTGEAGSGAGTGLPWRRGPETGYGSNMPMAGEFGGFYWPGQIFPGNYWGQTGLNEFS